MKAHVIGWLLVVCLLSLARALPAPAQDDVARDTPRSAVLGYLQAARHGDWERAAQYLDLRRLPAAERAQRGPVLARQLKVALDRKLWLEPDLLSESPEGHTGDGLPPRLDRVGRIDAARGPVDILVERVVADGQAVWTIAAATVAQIPALHEELGYGVLGELLPEPLVQIRVLEVALWQWIGLLALVVVAAALSWVVVLALARLLRPLAARLAPSIHDALIAALIGPLRLGVALLLFSIGALALALALPVQAFLGTVARALVIVTVTWFVLRAINILSRVVTDHLVARGRAAAVSVVPVGRKTTQVAVLGLGFLAVLQNVGINVTGILAGLGIGGLAIALAAQKTIENLFGGMTLLADQPVRVGDFCRFGDRVGIVEEIGLRSTRVRTLDRTLVSIPNAEFAGMHLENFAKRDRIWLRPTLSLRYETTPDQLRYVLVEIRKMLYAHPRVLQDPARIRFARFADSSLDLEVFAYVQTTDFGEFLAIQEDILLRIMDIVAASGTGFAFPSQTTYLGRDAGLDEAKSRAAEAQVRAWREQGQLFMPEFPPDAITELRQTLDYPPAGAPRA